MGPLVANARMYTVDATTDAAWRRLLQRVGVLAGVDLRYEPHPAPRPLEALWRRPDLGCALVCGYPWSTWDEGDAPRPVALGAPVPLASEGGATYRTDIVVRADSASTTLEHLRGGRFAYTTPGSQSGYQAPRRLFAPFARRPRAAAAAPGVVEAAGGRVFGATVGPLLTPRGVVDAVLRGDADAGPLDSYWLDLLRRHEPVTARELRVVASTPWTPLPLFACSAVVDDDVARRLGAALRGVGDDPALADARATLGLARIAAVDASTYAVLAEGARDADALGYPILQ